MRNCYMQLQWVMLKSAINAANYIKGASTVFFVDHCGRCCILQCQQTLTVVSVVYFAALC